MIVTLLLWWSIYLPLIVLLILYPIVIQYERVGKPELQTRWPWLNKRLHWLKYPYIFTAFVDVALNYTSLAVWTWDFPKDRSEVTFSLRIPRLLEEGGIIGDICYQVARWLNLFAPDHDHISQIK